MQKQNKKHIKITNDRIQKSNFKIKKSQYFKMIISLLEVKKEHKKIKLNRLTSENTEKRHANIKVGLEQHMVKII